MQNITAWSYWQVIRAVYPDITNTSTSQRNYPMFDNRIKLFKNGTQTVLIEIRSITRQLLTITDQDFYINVINRLTGELVARKQADPVDPTNGRMSFTFVPFDLVNIRPGNYSFSISTIDQSTLIETFLYLDHVGDATGDCEILDKALPAFAPSILVEDFNDVIYDHVSYKTSSYHPGDGQYYYTDGSMTAAVYCCDFTGNFYIDGSLAPVPSDTDWFPVLISEQYGHWEFKHFTGIESFVFTGALMWVRFRYLPSPLNYATNPRGESHSGILQKVLYRGTLNLRRSGNLDKPSP
jgi:hypothetical protein